MKSYIYLFLFTAVLLSSCKVADSNIQRNTNLKAYPLVHMVYFKTKENADIKTLIKEIQKIEAIPVLKNLEVGTFKNLGDSRAMSEFGVFMQMRFANEADYQSYQNHPMHIALKKSAGPYLAGPPVTYDYIRSEE